MTRAGHPKKEVEKALKAAEAADWAVTPTTAGHRWGKAECGKGCVISIWSTPKNSGNHAKQIDRAVRNCPHREEQA
jgi:hypothetical protein